MKSLLKLIGILLVLFAVSSPGRSFLTGFMAGLTGAAQTKAAPAAATPLPAAKTLPDKTSAAPPDYLDLNRNTEEYVGTTVTYTGTVVQVMEAHPFFSESVVYTLRIAVDGEIDQMIWTELTYADGTGWRPLEDDNVKLRGVVAGRQAYETVMGDQVVLPSITIETIKAY